MILTKWKHCTGASTIFIITLLGILHSTQSLKCYVCNSVIHANCGDSPPPSKYLFNCTDSTSQPSTKIMTVQRNDLEPPPDSKRNYTFCRKNIASIPEQHNKDTIRAAEKRIVRSCGWLEPPDPLDVCKWGAADGVHRQMCSCPTDECNGGNSNHVIINIQTLITFSILCFVSRTLLF